MIKSVLNNLSIWIIVIPMLVGIMNSKGLNNDSKWIFFLVSAAFVPQLLTAVLVKGALALNLSYNLYTPIEFGVLFILFFSKQSVETARIIMKVNVVIYCLACSYFFLRFGLMDRFLNELVCINNIFYMLWILLLLKQEYGSDKTLITKHNPFTWYLFSIILYAPSTLIVFALYHYIRQANNTVLMNLWMIQSLSNILLYLLITIGLLIRKTY